MKRAKDATITRYVYMDTREAGICRKWYVDIIDTDNMECTVDMFEAWYRPWDCGVSQLMFGVPKKQVLADGCEHETTYGEFVAMVEANIEDYIDTWEVE